MKKLTHGLLITLEGIDGSGKSTLARNLYTQLQQEYPILLTKQPGGSALGKELRTITQHHAGTLDPKAELLLFAADRAQLYTEAITPYLQKNWLVLSDRCADSSLIYQGYGRGLDTATIALINQWAMSGQRPDLVLYVTIDVATARTRCTQRQQKTTRFEQERDTFFAKLLQGYEKLYANRKDVVRIDGTQTPEHMLQEAITAITLYCKQLELT